MTNKMTAVFAMLAVLGVTAACEPMGSADRSASSMINNTPEGEPANATTTP